MSDTRAGFVRRPQLSRLTLVALTAVIIALAALAPRAAVNLSFGGRLVDAGNRQLGLEIGDFNEDGWLDVISADDNGGVTLMLNRTDLWFYMAPGFPMSVPNNPTDLVSGDFNNDLHLDVAVARRSGNAVTVLLGDGAGGFSSAGYIVDTHPFDIATGYFNDDAFLDLVTANENNSVPIAAPSVSILLGAGDGTFTPASPRDYDVGAAGALTRGVAVGDVTGDGEADVVAVNTNENVVRILIGGGDGTFTLSPTSYATTDGPRKVVLADFDENGSLDIATADSGDGVPPPDPSLRNNRATVLLNNGSGAFTEAPSSPFTTGANLSSPFAIKTIDMNGDGHLDLVTVNRHGASLSILVGDGEGGFAVPFSAMFPEFDPASPPESTDVVVGDFNNDGKPDMIGNAAGSPGFLILFNNTSTIAPPTVLATTPPSPSNVPTPTVSGTNAGGTVRLYTTSDCSGTPAASGTGAQFEGAGITVTVPPDTTQTFYATTINAAGWATSVCSSTSVSYTYDATPPDAPTIASSPVSPSNDNSPEMAGTAEADSTVRIYSSADCSGSAVATGTAAAFNSPGLTVSVTSDSTTPFTATATDVAGNMSACSSGISYTEDSTAPSAPSIDSSSPASPANDNSPTLLGTAEADSTVRIYVTADCSGIAAATGTAADFSSPGFTVSVADDTAMTFRATATDAAGNISACSLGLSYTEDSTAPGAPSIAYSSPASPSSNNSPTLIGTGEAASTVRIYTSVDCSGSPAASGTEADFSSPGFTMSVGDDSTTTFKATATDAAGNTSVCSSGLEYIEDSTAPSTPSITSSSPASPSNSNNPALLGTAEAGSTVTIYASGVCSGSPAAAGTAASFSSPGLTVGVADDSTTPFTATATDAAGNISACASGISYTEDSTAPDPPSIDSSSPASPSNDNTPRLFGAAEAGSTVQIYATADCSGSAEAISTAAGFSAVGVAVSVASDTLTTLRATATDAAGNKSACSSGLDYIEDSTLPAAPTISSSPASPANDNDPKLLGTAEAGSTVRIYTSADCSGTAAVTSTAAAFSSPGLTVSVASESTTAFTATAADAAGNTSACSSSITYIEDSSAPAAPSISSAPASPANDNNPALLGTAEAGSTVSIYTTVDCSGTPAVTGSAANFASPGLTVAVADDSSTTFTATATDAAGNTSACSAGLDYVEDSTAPSTPSITSSSPASPSNSNNPALLGTAEAGSTVRIYATTDCSGSAAATGSAAAFSAPGFTISVADNSETTFAATATDVAGNTSACSAGLDYIEDSSIPAAPSISSSPVSPANDNDPKLLGTAEAATTVTIYATADCTGIPAATGTAADFSSPGFTISVANDSTTTFTATATDAAGNASACSSSITYIEDSSAPAAPSISSAPASPANDNNPALLGTAEAGSTVRIYTSADCSGTAVATGTAAAFNSPGFTINVADNSATTFTATATDATGNTSACSSGFSYTEDSSAPAAPSIGSSPASPANDNSPELLGSAEAGSTVRIYTTADCSGSATVTGTAAAFSSPGLTVSVADGSTTTFKATATDAAGNTSACSTALVYIEDSTLPATPTISSSPASPANDNNPKLFGTAEAGSTVRIYTSTDCSGSAAATGAAAAFGSPGLTLTVADGSTTTFTATATDASGNTSACSPGISYIEDSTAPSAPSITGSSPASPANDNLPELFGAAEAGSTVRIYTTAGCTGIPAATGTAAAFSSPGFTVGIIGDTSTTFKATATDAAGNTSACSAGLTYSTVVCGTAGCFTDTLGPGDTIKVVHITELRARIDALRVRFGLLPMTWTDATLVAGETVIKAQHLIDLRVALAEAYQASQRPPQPFTDPTITATQSVISVAHIVELRFVIRMLEES